MALEVGPTKARLEPHDLRELRRLLEKLTGELDSPDPAPAYDRAGFADRVYRSRRLRTRYFPEDLFADPAWDILLLLYSLEPSGKQISVSAVCTSAGVPESTGHRWIERLIQDGLVIREKHPRDRRVNWVRLSDKTLERLHVYFDDLIAAYFPYSERAR
jgi:DNA-binding MarR family transcriptional regulator